MSVGWYIRRALAVDVESVLSLEQACDGAPHWSRASWLKALSEDAATITARAGFVAEIGQGLLGFAVFSCAGNLAELESLAVSSPARCQGVGRALCRYGLDWSRSQGADTVELEVRASNDAAILLYRSLGFVEQGRRLGYYHDPTEDALLMAAALRR